jgi:hypothetical protein
MIIWTSATHPDVARAQPRLSAKHLGLCLAGHGQRGATTSRDDSAGWIQTPQLLLSYAARDIARADLSRSIARDATSVTCCADAPWIADSELDSPREARR